MEEVPILEEKGETIEIINFDPIKIEQNEIIYILNMEAKEDKITFSINDKEQLPSVNYIRTMTLKEIKELNNNIITIIFYVEVLLKHQKIEIDLNRAKNDINLNIKEIYQELFNLKNKMIEIDTLKNENNNLKIKIEEISNEMDIIKNENIKLNNEIDTLKVNNKQLNIEINNLKVENNQMKLKIEEHNKEINYLKENIDKYINKSEIMKIDEKSMIFSEIENKMNKKIKKINKLYQATIDGGDPINFHLKCDNIPNTLVLIKSEGKRRFGGFTPIPWKSGWGDYIKDPEKKTFVFSLDNKKIYYLKDIENAVSHDKGSGPCFGRGCDINIEGNPLKENKLYTYQTSFDYKGDSKALSEYDGLNNLKALEYEVFQVIFY